MAAKKHDFTGTEIKAGIMVLASVAVAVLFLAITTGLRPPAPHKTFHVYFTDIAGLNVGADVRFGGLKAGRVEQILLAPESQSQIMVVAQTREDLPVNALSEAFITSVSLTAEKHLEISTGEDDAPLLESGATIPSRQGGLFDRADEIADTVTSLIADVKDLLGVEERRKSERIAEVEGTEPEEKLVTLADILAGVEGTVEEATGFIEDGRDMVGDARPDLEEILDKIKDVEDTVQEMLTNVNTAIKDNSPDVRASVENVRSILDNVLQLSEQLDGIANGLEASLANVSLLSGDAQGLLRNNRPVIDDVILDLRETVRYLKEFARTASEQPQSLIRGTEPQGRTSGD